MALKRTKSIGEALQHVADHPVSSSQIPLEMPIWELVSRELFKIANSPDARVRGSMARATKAQKIILDRLVGKRRPGTHPANATVEAIDFVDLTIGVLEEVPNVADDSTDDGRETGAPV